MSQEEQLTLLLFLREYWGKLLQELDSLVDLAVESSKRGKDFLKKTSLDYSKLRNRMNCFIVIILFAVYIKGGFSVSKACKNSSKSWS